MNIEVKFDRMTKIAKVVYRRIKGAWGEGDAETGIIEIDKRAKGKKHLEIFIHEATHIHYPFMDEDWVAEHASDLARQLWEHGYRRIDNADTEKLQDELGYTTNV